MTFHPDDVAAIVGEQLVEVDVKDVAGVVVAIFGPRGCKDRSIHYGHRLIYQKTYLSKEIS